MKNSVVGHFYNLYITLCPRSSGFIHLFWFCGVFSADAGMNIKLWGALILLPGKQLNTDMMLATTKSQIPRKDHILLVILFVNTKLALFSVSKEPARLLCSLFSMQSNQIMKDVPGSTELLSLTKHYALDF